MSRVPRLNSKVFLAALCLAAVVPTRVDAQAHITTPREAFGANFGDDYFLASYAQLSSYWRTLDRESDRMVVKEIGRTAEGGILHHFR